MSFFHLILFSGLLRLYFYDNISVLSGAGENIEIKFYYNGESVGKKEISVTQPHTVTFKDGEKTLYTLEVADGELLKLPVVDERTGYTFDGWYNGETMIEANYKVTRDLTLTAKWNANTYTVKFNANVNDDSVTGTMTDQTFTYDEEKTLRANAFTRTGYTFAGWNTQPDGKGTSYTDKKNVKNLKSENNATITLYAQWTANTYTVKFNANGGSGTMTAQTFTYDVEQALTANAFTREDYTFAGWAVKADGTATYADMAKVKNLTAEDKATVTLYAVWNENDKVLPVIFSVASETAVDCGDSVTLSCETEGAKICYTIGDETVEYTDAIVITKDVIITAFATKDGMKDSDKSTASYTVKTYTVTYKSDYDTVPSKIDGLKKGDKLTAEQLPVLTTDGYTFAGWYNGENEVTTEYKISSDLELSAKWTANTNTAYTVEHYQQNINDNQYSLKDTENKTGTTGENTTATAKDYAGFTVKSVEQAKIAADGSTVVKIYYDRNSITLTLDLDGGVGETEITGKYGADVTNPVNPTKTGYTFAGWNLDLPATLPAENVTYTAKWTANTYTVKFDANVNDNSVAGTMANQSFTYGTEQALTANAFTRTGYTFAGWVESAGGDVVYADKESVKNLKSENGEVTLYATWTADTYTITYNNCDEATNTNPANYTVETDTIKLKLADATKTGYTFDGWYDNANLTGEKITQIAKGSTGDITLYAKWTANKSGITITLPSINDAVINLQQSTSGNTVTFTVADSFGSYAWYIDGVKQSEASETFAINTSTMNPANYKIMVIVFDGNKYYSATADLEIRN